MQPLKQLLFAAKTTVCLVKRDELIIRVLVASLPNFRHCIWSDVNGQGGKQWWQEVDKFTFFVLPAVFWRGVWKSSLNTFFFLNH